jgi:hypothetical protein
MELLSEKECDQDNQECDDGWHNWKDHHPDRFVLECES